MIPVVSDIERAGTSAFLVPAVLVKTQDFRLTTETGVAVSTSDRTSQSTIYLTPYSGNQIALFNGSAWVLYSTAEISLTLSGLTSGKNYDVFAYYTGSAVALELSAAWTTDTSRADAIALQNGISCKSGTLTRRLVGTIRTTGTTTTEDSYRGSTTNDGSKRFVANKDNKVWRDVKVTDTGSNWSYTTATWRQAQAIAGNRVECVSPDLLQVNIACACTVNVTGYGPAIGIGIDSTTVNSALFGTAGGAANVDAPFNALLRKSDIAAGYHALNWLELGTSGTCIFTVASTNRSSGMQGSVLI